MRAPAAFAALVLTAGMVAHPAEGRVLVADLSRDEIDISTGFAGTELLLFGAKEPGGDVVVVIRGPARDQHVQRRRRVAGMWVNGRRLTFRGLPAYYHVLSNRPLEEIAPPARLAERRIGLDRLAFAAAAAPSGDTAAVWRAALVRNKLRQGLYGDHPGGVVFAADRLFRASAAFPANVPTGPYRVEVYLFADGREIVRRVSTLVIRKVGVGATLFAFAHRHSALYGAAAILVALFFGWTAGLVFRR